VRSARSLLVIGGLLLSSCAGAATENDFADVARVVEERTGQRATRWTDGRPDPQLDQAVSPLLRGHAMTVDEAVQVALLRNPRLQALYEGIGISRADLVQAGLLRNPVFDGSIRWGNGSPVLDLSVAQEFLSVLFLPFRARIAEAQLEATKARVAEGVLEVEGETRDAFIRLQAEMQLLEMREQVRTATSAALDAAKALHEAGNIPDLDVNAQRSLFDRAQLAVAASRSAVVSARERLNVQMGVWGADTEWTIDMRLPAVPAGDPDLADVEGRAVAANLTLVRLRHEVLGDAQEAELAGASRGFADVELGATAEREESEWSAGPSIALPIPLFEQGQAGASRALARLRRREMDLRGTAIAVRAAARAAAQRFVTARESARFHREQVLPTQARIVESTQLQYNAMQVGVFQLLDAKREQIEAGQGYIAALREYWLARTSLEQIVRGRVPRDALAQAEVGEPSEGGAPSKSPASEH
jgi:cobalt-zinc-cadmium efflux system outer membrane protein